MNVYRQKVDRKYFIALFTELLYSIKVIMNYNWKE